MVKLLGQILLMFFSKHVRFDLYMSLDFRLNIFSLLCCVIGFV